MINLLKGRIRRLFTNRGRKRPKCTWRAAPPENPADIFYKILRLFNWQCHLVFSVSLYHSNIIFVLCHLWSFVVIDLTCSNILDTGLTDTHCTQGGWGSTCGALFQVNHSLQTWHAIITHCPHDHWGHSPFHTTLNWSLWLKTSSNRFNVMAKYDISA